MKWLVFGVITLGFSVAVVSAQQSKTETKPETPVYEFNSVENRMERLETIVRTLSLNIERMQMADKDLAVNYDYKNGFSILRFYQLESFDGKLKKCQIWKPTDPVDPKSEGPTCRLTIERRSDGKIMTIDNFKTLPGSKEKLDVMLEQESCNFPGDISRLRHSILYD